MILRPQQIHLLRMGRPVVLANIGGDSSSSSPTTTNTTTTTTVANTQRNVVASDAAIAVSGDGNTINRNIADNSIKDSGNTTTFTDNSNRSTNTDNHAVTNVTTTDFGAVGSALAGMGAMGSQVTGMAGNAISKAFDSANQNSADSANMISQLFDFTGKSSANTLTTANQVLGYAAAETDKTNAAFAVAKGSMDTSKIVTYAIAGIAAVGLAFAFKKG